MSECNGSKKAAVVDKDQWLEQAISQTFPPFVEDLYVVSACHRAL